MAVVVQEVEAMVTYRLRRDVLRPGKSLEEVASEDEGSVAARYFAIFEGEELLSSAMVQLKSPPHGLPTTLDLSCCYQLRAMATSPERRNEGLGTLLLETVITSMKLAGATLLWCNARLRAVSFYERAGMKRHGEVFEIEHIGPHVVMWRVP